MVEAPPGQTRREACKLFPRCVNKNAYLVPIPLVPGNYYTSYYFSNIITQCNAAGNVVRSLPVSYGDEVRGLAFGPDNLLYATVASGPSGSTTYSVVALNSAGVAQQTYPRILNQRYAKIAMDGQYLYVAGDDHLTRFFLGNPSSGTSITQKVRSWT